MYKKIFSALVLCSFLVLWGQEVPIGQFKEYLPYNKFYAVAQDSENIYIATIQNILVVNKKDEALEKWSNLNGLSDVGIQTIYSDPKGRLIIAYKNSNIDVIQDRKVYNIRDILNKQVSGSKTINNVTTIGELAYLACDFGVVIIDLKTHLVKDSWFTLRNNDPFRALQLAEHNQQYYIGTDKGVFSLPVSASNPADFSKWERESELPQASFKFLCSFQNKLFAVRDGGSAPDTVFVNDNAHWGRNNLFETNFYRGFEVNNGKMLVCCWNHVKLFSGSSNVAYTWNATPPRIWQGGSGAIIDEKSNIWVADFSSGLVHIDTKTKEYEMITTEGPENNSAYGLCINNGMVAVVPGSRYTALVPMWNAPAISIMKDDHWWSNISFSQYPNAYGFNSVAINPKDTNEIYIASWNGGLFKINKATNETFCYNSDNSILKSARTNGIIFLSGLAIDKQNILWMAQSEVIDQIKVKDLNTEEEKWDSFVLGATPVQEAIAEHILIDSRDYKWVTIPRTNQLFVLRGTIGNIEKSNFEVDMKSEAKVSGNSVTCVAEDREGNIWVGCDQGVKVIYDAGSVFSRKLYAKNILVDQMIGSTIYTQILLENEYIKCIAVDAANQKWIGTRNAGVFLLSPTGTQELFHFTTDNSPLFSNQINDIKINHENGEVFIATEGGLISYKGTATIGKKDYKEALVYPNPVREGYYGPIAVKGLMEDSFCKITDSAGNLVWQGIAYGGQLIWNGKDFYGNRPATGVYFVMASSKSGKEKTVAKFLFIQ